MYIRKGKYVPVQVIKEEGGVEVQFHSFLPSKIDGAEQPVSHQQSNPHKHNIQTLYNRCVNKRT
jgi:hypothetical protein